MFSVTYSLGEESFSYSENRFVLLNIGPVFRCREGKTMCNHLKSFARLDCFLNFFSFFFSFLILMLFKDGHVWVFGCSNGLVLRSWA